MSVELAGLTSSLSALGTIAKALVGVRDAAKFNPKIIEFQQILLQANAHALALQNEHTSLIGRVGELEKERLRLKDWSAEKENYAVKQIGEGVFAYVEKQFVGEYESAQKLCVHCFQQGTKALLQGFKIKVGRRVGVVCHKCSAGDEFDYWYRSESSPPPKST